MKCTSCGDEPQTTGAIKDCRRCVKKVVDAAVATVKRAVKGAA